MSSFGRGAAHPCRRRRGGRRLDETRRPDHLPAQPHAPIDTRDRPALARTGEPEPVDAAMLHRLGARGQAAAGRSHGRSWRPTARPSTMPESPKAEMPDAPPIARPQPIGGVSPFSRSLSEIRTAPRSGATRRRQPGFDDPTAGIGMDEPRVRGRGRIECPDAWRRAPRRIRNNRKSPSDRVQERPLDQMRCGRMPQPLAPPASDQSGV
jgi:hypothetical protein